MPYQPQSQANSLLNLLNPYQQSTRDVRHHPHSHPEEGGEDEGELEPESPSAMLLRELQGGDEDSEGEREGCRGGDREGMSPTPTPSRSTTGLGLASITNDRTVRATTAGSSSEDGDGDGDQPPQSIMYAKAKPASRSTSHRSRGEESPGPFRPAGSSSTSTVSASASRSASTSPGPSTISNYASGLDPDLGNTVDPASVTSPISPGNTRRVHIPTFREPPGPSRVPSGSRSTPESNSRLQRKLSGERGEGYLDPPLSSSRKGKGKARNVGGRKYHQVSSHPDEPGLPRERRKEGLNEYEKALWSWVNVDDLDGFLQEVSLIALFVKS